MKKGRSVDAPALLLDLVSPKCVEANSLSKNSLYACFGPRSGHTHRIGGFTQHRLFQHAGDFCESRVDIVLRSPSAWRRICGRAWARALAGSGRTSAVETSREVEMTEALGVREDVDLDDLPAPDRESHHR